MTVVGILPTIRKRKDFCFRGGGGGVEIWIQTLVKELEIWLAREA